ncbi:bis(5'-nucleosyl)-tetraphosphatase [Nanoarchaeota archaeon]
MNEEKSCGILLVRGKLFLLLHYTKGHWGFPKGGVEPGEEEKETALRELKEETGISEVKFIPGFRHVLRYQYKAGGEYRDKSVVYFLGETQAEDVKISHEHQGFKWLGFEEALEQITYGEEKNLLNAAMHHLKSHDSRLDRWI